MKIETQCLHEGYHPGNGDPRVVPIVQSTTYTYDSTEHIAKLFDLTADGYMYSRFVNPTVDALEKKLAALEGGVGALCTTSGQMANLMAILNLCKAGDSFLSTGTIYGGTVNLFAVTLKRFGIECIFVDAEAPAEEIAAAIRPNTKSVVGETLANPAMAVFDIEKFAAVAHAHGIPLIVDNTFATPILCRPFEFGADIVTHSTTKYIDGHAVQVGGVIVDSGRFDWKNGNFPEFTEPDESYHGVVYTRYCDDMAFSGRFDPDQVIRMVRDRLRELGLFLNDGKTRLMYPGRRQTVTGVVVNQAPAVPVEYRRALRQELYFCRRFGVEEHLRRRGVSDPPQVYLTRLLGRVNYVLQITPDHREMLEYRDWLRSALAEKKNGNFCEKE